MYVAASGAIAAGKRLDTITNNLANINTPGFKMDQLVFETILAQSVNAPPASGDPSSLNNKPARQSEYVVATDIYTDHSQGPIKETGAPLDIALMGDGFISVMTYDGERYTRAGNLKIGQDGALVTAEGHIVLDQTDRAIYVNSSYVTIDNDGNVWLTDNADYIQTPELAGRLKLVEFVKPNNLQKQGDGLYKASNPGEAMSAQDTKVIQGSLESSNVNMIREMTGIIQNQRLAQAFTKVIQTSDQMTGTMLNRVART